MSGYEFTDQIMECYDKHFAAFRKDVDAMNLKPANRNLAWAYVMSQISMDACREAVSNGAYMAEEKARSEPADQLDFES